MLNYEEIISKNLIQNSDGNNFRNASYDLRVDEIITKNGKTVKSFNIEPNSMVVAISKERVKLPNNIIGHAFVKTRLSQNGIMANNIGIIDTEYDGQLSSVLVNFGKTDYPIKEGDTFLRITFAEILNPRVSIPINYGPFSQNDYLNERRSGAMSYLGNSFISIDRVVQEARKEIQNSFRRTAKVIGIWIAAIGLLLTSIALYTNIKDNTSKQIENLQNQINTFNENQLLLLKTQKELEKNTVSFLYKSFWRHSCNYLIIFDLNYLQ